MDLLKAFDTINHDLLIAKLYAYGFDKDSLKTIWSYLNNRWQRTKINTTFSSWSELTRGVPQGSVLGPILFNIYLNDLFFILSETDICNFADDTTPFACDSNLDNVLLRLKHDSALALAWFECNYMKLNTDKCHLLMAGNKIEDTWVKIGENKLWETGKVKLLGINIDNQLKFDHHVLNLCAKANQKLSALTRMARFLSFEKRRTLFKAFFESQFKYSPLIWMFYGRQANNRINQLHERALRLVYNDFISSFEDLLERDGSFTVHHSNIQFLAIELYKVIHGFSAGIISDKFFRKNNSSYNLRSQSDFCLPVPRTEQYGKNSLQYFGPIVWNMVPQDIGNSSSLSEFKIKIKKWKPLNCPCKLCIDYLQDLGYINFI